MSRVVPANHHHPAATTTSSSAAAAANIDPSILRNLEERMEHGTSTANCSC